MSVLEGVLYRRRSLVCNTVRLQSDSFWFLTDIRISCDGPSTACGVLI